jgi:hypothetical protein
MAAFFVSRGGRPDARLCVVRTLALHVARLACLAAAWLSFVPTGFA